MHQAYHAPDAWPAARGDASAGVSSRPRVLRELGSDPTLFPFKRVARGVARGRPLRAAPAAAAHAPLPSALEDEDAHLFVQREQVRAARVRAAPAVALADDDVPRRAQLLVQALLYRLRGFLRGGRGRRGGRARAAAVGWRRRRRARRHRIGQARRARAPRSFRLRGACPRPPSPLRAPRRTCPRTWTLPARGGGARRRPRAAAQGGRAWLRRRRAAAQHAQHTAQQRGAPHVNERPVHGFLQVQRAVAVAVRARRHAAARWRAARGPRRQGAAPTPTPTRHASTAEANHRAGSGKPRPSGRARENRRGRRADESAPSSTAPRVFPFR